jgi:hypothetical protein
MITTQLEKLLIVEEGVVFLSPGGPITDRQKYTGTQEADIHRHTDRQAGRLAGSQVGRRTYIQTYRKTTRPTDRQAD